MWRKYERFPGVCIIRQNPIIQDLIDAGIIPGHSYTVTINLRAGGVATMHVDLFLTPEEFGEVAAALKRHPDEAKRMLKTIAYKAPGPMGGKGKVDL